MQVWVTYTHAAFFIGFSRIKVYAQSSGLFVHVCECLRVCVHKFAMASLCRNSRIRCFLLSMLLQGHCFCGCSGRVSMEYWPLGMPRLEP